MVSECWGRGKGERELDTKLRKWGLGVAETMEKDEDIDWRPGTWWDDIEFWRRAHSMIGRRGTNHRIDGLFEIALGWKA